MTRISQLPSPVVAALALPRSVEHIGKLRSSILSRVRLLHLFVVRRRDSRHRPSRVAVRSLVDIARLAGVPNV